MGGIVLRIGGHDWRCIAGYGHAPDRIALHAPALNTLISGDMVLPSHGKLFSWLHERIAQLAAHHEERFADVLAACAEGPNCAADLLGVLFRRKLDLHQMTFEMEESVAHLHARMPGTPVCAHANRLRRALEACCCRFFTET